MINSEEKEAALMERYAEIKKFVMYRQVPQDDVEDVVQEIFILASSRLYQLRDFSKLPGWLYKIARREIGRYWRVKGKRATREVHYEACEGELENWCYNRKIAEEASFFNDEEELFEMLKEFREPIPYIFELRYKRGYKLKEIAEILQMNYSSIRVMEHRTIGALREKFQQSRGGNDEK